jgi:hypothetical protein
LRPWLEPLLGHIRRAGDSGLSMRMAGKTMAAQPGFTPALREQRATLQHMVALWPESIRVEKRRGQRVLFVQEGVSRPAPAPPVAVVSRAAPAPPVAAVSRPAPVPPVAAPVAGVGPGALLTGCKKCRRNKKGCS